MPQDDILLNLALFRENLQKMMNPKVLEKFVEFLDATGHEDSSMLHRYKWFVENGENGADCRYARMAKDFFLQDHADGAAKAIIWLYHNWARGYE